MFQRLQRGRGLGQAKTLEQHVLDQRRNVQPGNLTAQRGGDALDLLALGLGLVAIGKRSQQGHGEQGALLFSGHGFSPSQ